MPNLYASKRPHDLHRSVSAADFQARFETRAGRSVVDLVRAVLPGSERQAILLTGSIPDGIGNDVSDVDLMVVVDTDGPVCPTAEGFGAPAAVKTAVAGALELSVLDSVIGGVETDIAVISGRRLGDLCERLDRGGASLQEDEIRTLTRVKRGWVLADHDDYLQIFDSLVDGLGLEIYCSTTYYALALKRLEDAFPAAETNANLAVYLGRLAVESGLQAYLAALGHCYPSAKWPALLARHAGEPTVGQGIALMFPQRMTKACDIRDYLGAAQALVIGIRGRIERDRALRIAFDYCPQIYRPDFASTAS